MVPKVDKKFKQLNADINYFTNKWFICVFTSVHLDWKIVEIIWDFLLLQGRVAIIKATISIFMILEKYILGANSFEEIDEVF